MDLIYKPSAFLPLFVPNHNKNVKAEAHKISVIFPTPIMVYKLTNPIRSKLFNNCVSNKNFKLLIATFGMLMLTIF